MELNALQSAVYALVKRYIQRQSLVLEIMKDLRPAWVAATSKHMRPEEKVRLLMEHNRSGQYGTWGENDEWDYFFHGLGCRLIHKITQERIEWDIGSLSRFEKHWFANHLKWRLDQHTDDEHLAVVREWLEQTDWQSNENPYDPHNPTILVLEQLHDAGLLSQYQQYYTLTSDEFPDWRI